MLWALVLQKREIVRGRYRFGFTCSNHLQSMVQILADCMLPFMMLRMFSKHNNDYKLYIGSSAFIIFLLYINSVF